MLTIYLLPEGKNAEAEQLSKEAAGRAFTNAKVEVVANVDAALLKAPGTGAVLLVLIEPTMTEVALAVESVSLNGLPRFAYVILGGEVQQGGFELVPKEEWNVPLLSHVLRAAVGNFELARESARFRGDLHSMARRISHDLRSPLTGIFATAELVQEILGDSSPEDAELAKPLFDSSQALMRLIDRVSFLGKATVESKAKEDVEMGKVIWAARQGVERLILQKGGQLSEPKNWPTVNAVVPWLEVIWANLLMNAFQHGGAAPKVEVGWTELVDEDALKFWICDSGAGVPEAKRGQLFHPFHRLHERNSAHGLGLSIVQRLVEMQGGRCGYETAAGGGGCFFFTLPRTGEPAPHLPL